MNDIITNGTEIKQRIISEINKANQNVYIAMAWFTDRDIANAVIDAKNRDVTVEIILSSNMQNEIVKQMFYSANINVHAFETGDVRGIMHHKFCLIDSKISINGSYNYSYNASNNNVENIHISDDFVIYGQFLAEFERLKYNIDHDIDVNSTPLAVVNDTQITQPMNSIDAFSQQLHNLVYLSAQINADDYKKQGYEKSKETVGNIDIFRAEYNNIVGEIKILATNDGLNSKKNILLSNVSAVFESKKTNLETEKQAEITSIRRDNDLELRQVNDKIKLLKDERSVLESGSQNSGEKGLFQINKEIEKNKLEKKNLEQSFIVKKFWSIGTSFMLLFLAIFVFYLSIFFASAMYKVFFESNDIRASLEAGINPGLPQLVDANAILKIFKQQGTLFGIMALLFFLIPILLSNLNLIGSNKIWVNYLCFWIGVLIFDVLVATMVAINTDEIKNLLIGQKSQMKIWDTFIQGEFWLIFVFGMLPLVITHYIITYITNAYKKSQKDLVDAEKVRKIQILDEEMIDLLSAKESLNIKINDYDASISANNKKIEVLETELNNQNKHVESKYLSLVNQFTNIVDDFKAKIMSGKIFTDEILISIISAYKSGFIEYLPEYYAEEEVARRAKIIEQTIQTRI